MFVMPRNSRLFICDYPVSMKNSFEGLSYMVEQLFPNELLSGAFFIFLNKTRTHIKIFAWDNDGFVILYKRLEKGTFKWKWNDIKSVDRKTFLMLFEGITPKSLERRYTR
jgi:transposase